MLAVSWIDLVIVIGYLLAMMGVGIWSSRKVRNLADYSLAGRSLGYPVMIGTLVGATIGAASTFGKAAKAHEVGSFLFLATLGYPIGLILFGFFSSQLRKAELWTIPEAIRMRYGRGMETVIGAVMLVAVIAVFGVQIIGMGAIFSSVGKSFGLTSNSAILIAGSVIIFYNMVGGLFAVAYTDLIQSLIMVVGVGILLPAAVWSDVAATGNAWEILKPQPGNFLGGMTPLYVISIFLIDIPFCLVDPGLWQRANAARNEKVIRRSMFVTAGVYLYWSLVCVALGVLGAALIPNIAPQYGSVDALIPALAIRSLPPVALGFCLTGLMAVMMSTASVVLLITGTTLAHDLIKPLRPQTSERTLLISAKITVLIVGIFGIGFALCLKGIFDLLLLAFAIYISGVFFPTLAALYWDRATKAGAVASSVIATMVVVILYALDKPFGIEPIMVSLVVSLLTMVMVSLATHDPLTATPRLLGKTGNRVGR